MKTHLPEGPIYACLSLIIATASSGATGLEGAPAESAPPSSVSRPRMPPRVELSGLGGGQFGGNIDFDGGSASLKAGPTAGGLIGVRVAPWALAVAGYHYQFSEAAVQYTDINRESITFDLAIGYLQIGGELEFDTRTIVRPYMGMTLGAMHFTPDLEDVGSDWNFAAALFGGLKVVLWRRFGLRLQVKGLITVLGNESESLCFAGRGCVVALDVSVMGQGEVSGGVYLAF